MMEQKSLLERLRTGDEAAFREAYREHRMVFLRWAYSISRENKTALLDIYQDALIIFFKNLCAGKVVHLDNGLTPYLFGIGKKLILARRLKVRQEISMDPADEVFLSQLEIPEPNDSNEEWKKNFDKAMGRLSENCQKIIEWFYYRDYSIEEITARLGYSSDDATRVTKMRCLKKLRELMLTK